MTPPKKLISVVFALLFLIPSAAVAQSKAAPSAADPVRALLERLFAAWSDLDPAKAAPFYAKDSDLTFFDIAPMKYNNWSEYAAGVPQAFAAYRSGKFTLNPDLRTHRHGNLAWATATWRAELTRKDGGIEKMEGRYTAIVQRRGEQWLVIHDHMSVPPPPPPQ